MQITETRITEFTEADKRIGATYVEGEGCYIRLWAPKMNQVSIAWQGGDTVELTAEARGYYSGFFPDAKPGDRYFFVTEGGENLPDPASRYQPEGLFGPSEVVDQSYDWQAEAYKPVPYDQWVIYEIHTGTFSSRHDFQGIIDDLPRLKKLGVTTLEIMPVSAFSGDRNWGYDGAFPHAVQDSYGGPSALKNLVDQAHQMGFCIVLDVVYNHLGPEGNILSRFGHYFQDCYHTPWGEALNFDGADSEEVRRYFLQTVWQWLTEYKFDGLRLDAVQTIFDTSPVPFLEEIARLKTAAEKQRDQSLGIIAETDMNDSRLIAPYQKNGMGMDSHWADDLHHSLHALLTGERQNYYQDYGSLDQLAKIYQKGVAFDGNYSPFRKRNHGRSYDGLDPKQLIVETQNHDQIGNRAFGDRLINHLDFESLKLMSAAVLLSPFTPMIFMGEEYGAENPFHYFVSHEDKDLNKAVREGRKAEFDFIKNVPDPTDRHLFEDSVLADKSAVPRQKSGVLFDYHQHLIALSKIIRKLDCRVDYDPENEMISLAYLGKRESYRTVLSFNENPVAFTMDHIDQYETILNSALFETGDVEDTDVETGIVLAPFSAIVLRKKM
jgi:maltooligosyltrehalose trehalohydrolase